MKQKTKGPAVIEYMSKDIKGVVLLLIKSLAGMAQADPAAYEKQLELVLATVDKHLGIEGSEVYQIEEYTPVKVDPILVPGVFPSILKATEAVNELTKDREEYTWLNRNECGQKMCIWENEPDEFIGFRIISTTVQ